MNKWPAPTHFGKRGKPKLAELVAERIQDHVVALDWPAGHLLGNEAQLVETYNVSRATLREAVRQLERHGVATMRRGAGGGLIVQNSARAAAIQAMATYLELADITLQELFEARQILELRSIALAIQRLSDDDIADLRTQLRLLDETPMENLDQELGCAKAIRLAITTASRNLALSLFLEALTRGTGGLMPGAGRMAKMSVQRHKSRETLRQLVEAVISGKLSEAEQAVRARLGVIQEFATLNLVRFRRETKRKSALESGAAPQVAEWDNNQKLPHRLAIVIARDVAQGKMPSGTRIGSETEFLERYGVSRAIFREAVRLLEGYGIVQMRRGQGGGLTVGRPDPSHSVSLVGKYLVHGNLSDAQTFEVLHAIELAVAPLAAARAAAEEIGSLKSAAAALRSGSRREILDGISSGSARLAHCVENRAISLLGQIVHQLAPRFRYALPSLAECQALLKLHAELLTVIAARDEVMARRKAMRMIGALDRG